MSITAKPKLDSHETHRARHAGVQAYRVPFGEIDMAAIRDLADKADKIELCTAPTYALILQRGRVLHAWPGQWLIRYPDGALETINDDAFTRVYEDA